MAARTKEQDSTVGGDDEAVTMVNEVRLVGRVSQDPEERVLPSGDSLWTFRLVVGRTGDRRTSRQTVDVLDCAVWGGRVLRSVSRWHAGDLVELSGAVRRRFFRGVAGTASRVEIEVGAGRLIRRASSG